MHYVDLSHTIEHGMVTYKGLPAPIICDFLSREAAKKQYSEITTFQIGKIELVANTGTYVDAPFHRHADGKDLSAPSLESLVNLEGLVFRTRQRANGSELFRNADVRGKAVLVNAGWAQYDSAATPIGGGGTDQTRAAVAAAVAACAAVAGAHADPHRPPVGWLSMVVEHHSVGRWRDRRTRAIER
jgi:kynurenine formamidase